MSDIYGLIYSKLKVELIQSKITCYMSSGMLNDAHFLIIKTYETLSLGLRHGMEEAR